MPRYKLIIEYDGTGLAGWQRQDDAPSVQQHIEDAIELFSGEKVRLHTAGRTDAGVHAFGQVAHFDMQRDFPADKIMGATNYHLKPNKIALLNVEIVDEEFHARFSAKKRYYVYKIKNRRAPLVLDAKRMWFVPTQIDVEKMQLAAKFLVGKHDFTSLRDSQCQAQSALKTLDEVRVEQNGDVIEIYVCAKSFLHHMVRNIAGTLKFVGEGKFSPDDIPKIIEAKNRSAAGPTAPAHGLYFIKVDY